MPIQLSLDCSCVYHQCDQVGHSVCPVVADHIHQCHEVLARITPKSAGYADAQRLLDFDDRRPR